MSRKGKKKAQSTLEYILVLTAVVGLIIFAAARWIKPSTQQALGDANNAMNAAANKLQ
jgi:Na+-driven multidrug efflux pump